jgi:hypothetical protein
VIAEAYKSGADDARRDIAAGKLHLHYQLRGEWGQDLKETLMARFGVEVIELTCFTSDQEKSYEAGYDAAVTSHVNRIFGPGSVEAAYQEVWSRRMKKYNKWVAENKSKLP